jgi:hypothetical protein
MGKKKAKTADHGDPARFASALKGVLMNLVLTTASCAAVYAILTAARTLT